MGWAETRATSETGRTCRAGLMNETDYLELDTPDRNARGHILLADINSAVASSSFASDGSVVVEVVGLAPGGLTRT